MIELADAMWEGRISEEEFNGRVEEAGTKSVESGRRDALHCGSYGTFWQVLDGRLPT